MLELISVLLKVLMLEAIILIATALVSVGLLLSEIKDGGLLEKGVKNIFAQFKKEVCSEGKYSKLYTATVVIYGMTKLTALWCFSILFGVLVTSNMWAIVGILILEVLFIALQIRNKFMTNKEDVIDIKWLKLKLEGIVQNKIPKLLARNTCEEIKKSIRINMSSNKNI